MAINATNVQLNVAIVGDDQTGDMLIAAQKKVDALEKEMAQLAKTSKATQAATASSASAFGTVNTRMATAAKSAEGLVDGFDKTKNAIGKITGALGFWGAAITGAIALGSEFASAIAGMRTEADKQVEAFGKLSDAANKYRASLDDVVKSSAAALAGAHKISTSAAAIDVEIARRRSGQDAAGLAEVNLRIKQAADSRLEAQKAVEQADADLRKVQETASTALVERMRLDNQIAQLDAAITSRKKRNVTEDVALLTIHKGQAVAMRALLEGSRVEADKALGGLRNRLKDLENLRDKLGELGQEPEVIELGETEITPPKPTGAGRPRESDRDRADREARQAKERREQEIRMNREFTAQAIENSRLREEREREEMRFAEEAAAMRERFAEARERFAREDAAAPVLGFADALTSNLVPALGEVEAAMARVTDIFEQFREGQVSMTEAIGAGAMELAAFTAKSIGGVKAEAAVRAAYEAAMGFATLATPAISAGHFTAAAMLTGVATGIIGSGSSAATKSAPKAAEPRKKDATATDKGGSTNVYNIQAGIGDPQSIRRTLVQADRASSGTGYTRWGGV